MFVFELEASWVYARRRRILLETPAAARRIWVEDAIGNFYFVKADFGKGAKTVAEHNDVRNTVAQLEAAGCVVENVPKWCRNPDAPLPVTASYGDAHPTLMPVLALLSLLVVVGILAADWFMRHSVGQGLFPH